MVKLRSLVAVAAVVVGLGAGAFAFQTLAERSPGPDPRALAHAKAARAASHTRVTVPRILPGRRLVWARCVAPAVLRHDTCVTRVVRTVTVPGTD